ncbi:MAG: hypothetical protein MRY49_02550 [Candidatus Pacebacteria bacterium]|nr:hypothetical protein [Candidatus Paceibacterota bacterium]
MKTLILNIQGGVGKNIVATVPVKQYKKENPTTEIIIITPYGFIWDNNPNISEVLHPEKTHSLYQRRVKNKEVIISASDPYQEQEYILKDKHLADIWCEILDVEREEEMPELFFTDKEKEEAERVLKKEGPVFMIQTNGGAEGFQKYPISWARDLPLNTAQEIVDEMNKKGYRTIHLRRKDQPQLENTEYVEVSLRILLYMITLANKTLLIDSVFQHALAAQGKKSVVCWIVNDPKNLGYDIHENIIAPEQEGHRHHLESYLERDDITGAIHQYPYNTTEIFPKEEILKLLDSKASIAR